MTDGARRRARATIRAVAQMAQVSIGTASNVLNNPELVAPSTRARVIDTIRGPGSCAARLHTSCVSARAAPWASCYWTSPTRSSRNWSAAPSMCCETRATRLWSARVTSPVSVSAATCGCSRSTGSTAY
jgi:hypothetical protein